MSHLLVLGCCLQFNYCGPSCRTCRQGRMYAEVTRITSNQCTRTRTEKWLWNGWTELGCCHRWLCYTTSKARRGLVHARYPWMVSAVVTTLCTNSMAAITMGTIVAGTERVGIQQEGSMEGRVHYLPLQWWNVLSLVLKHAIGGKNTSCDFFFKSKIV